MNLGYGVLESIYESALKTALRHRGLVYEAQKEVTVHFAQVKSYLKATGLHVGLLLNFNAPTLVVKRVVLDFNPAGRTLQ